MDHNEPWWRKLRPSIPIYGNVEMCISIKKPTKCVGTPRRFVNGDVMTVVRQFGLFNFHNKNNNPTKADKIHYELNRYVVYERRI